MKIFPYRSHPWGSEMDLIKKKTQIDNNHEMESRSGNSCLLKMYTMQ